MVPISKNGKKQEHQTINFFNIKRLSYIYLITAQPPLNDTNGDTTLSSKQLWTPSLQSLLIHVDCMLISTGMNVEAPYSRAKDQMEKKCWNVPVETWHYNSRNKLYYCNRIDVPLWNKSTEVAWLQNHEISESRSALLNPSSHFKLILLEISCLDFTGSSLKIFETYLNLKLHSVRITKKCQEVAIRASHYIYCRRNKIWSEPESISYT